MNAKAILREYGDTPVCGRCLVMLDARTPIRAKHPDGALEHCESPTNPVVVKAWFIEKYLDDQRWWFEIGSTTDRFIPIATMYGDQVCAFDLYALVDLERRRFR